MLNLPLSSTPIYVCVSFMIRFHFVVMTENHVYRESTETFKRRNVHYSKWAEIIYAKLFQCTCDLVDTRLLNTHTISSSMEPPVEYAPFLLYASSNFTYYFISCTYNQNGIKFHPFKQRIADKI